MIFEIEDKQVDMLSTVSNPEIKKLRLSIWSDRDKPMADKYRFKPVLLSVLNRKGEMEFVDDISNFQIDLMIERMEKWISDLKELRQRVVEDTEKACRG